MTSQSSRNNAPTRSYDSESSVGETEPRRRVPGRLHRPSLRLRPSSGDIDREAAEKFFSSRDFTVIQMNESCTWFLAQCAPLPHKRSRHADLIRTSYGAIIAVQGLEVSWRRLRREETEAIAQRAAIEPLVRGAWNLSFGLRNIDLQSPLEAVHLPEYRMLFDRFPIDLGIWMKLSVCSYDKKGLACVEREIIRHNDNHLRSDNEYLRIGNRSTPKLSFPWARQVSGEIWHFRPSTNILPFKAIAFILSLCQLYEGGKAIAWHRRKAFDFLHGYCSVNEDLESHYTFARGRRLIFAEWHIRTLHIDTDSKKRGKRLKTPPDGLRISRETGEITISDGSKTFEIEETRMSIYLITKPTSHLPVFRIICLSDNSRTFEDYTTSDPPGCLAGIAKYIAMLFGAVERWGDDSRHFLDKLDSLVRVHIGDVLNPVERHKLMFDNSFARSNLYFTILQLLREFEEWIRESKKSLEDLKEGCIREMVELAGFPRTGYEHRPFDDYEDPVREAEIKGIKEEWSELIAKLDSVSLPLLERIERKSTEVKSLRDGLFNATSVLEASRSTTLNQYIVVFTVVTIFYLPLSFVATIFGMHLFDSPDSSQTQGNFYATIVVVSVLTYLISFISLWGVRARARYETPWKVWVAWLEAIFGRRGQVHRLPRDLRQEGPKENRARRKWWRSGTPKTVLEDFEAGNARRDSLVEISDESDDYHHRNSLEEPEGIVVMYRSQRRELSSESDASRTTTNSHSYESSSSRSESLHDGSEPAVKAVSDVKRRHST